MFVARALYPTPGLVAFVCLTACAGDLRIRVNEYSRPEQ